MKLQLEYFIVVICAFFLPIAPLLLTVGLFIAADTVYGLYKAIKLKQKITSRKLSNVVSKMLLYQGCLMLFFMMEKFILSDLVLLFSEIPFLLTKLVATLLCLIELKSIDESYVALNKYSLWDKFKLMIRRAKELKDEFKE